MKFEDINKLKIGDTIYSFIDKQFNIYKVTNICNFTHELTVYIESTNNVKNGETYKIIEIPSKPDYNTPNYGYEFTTMDMDLNTAYQNYSESINRQIRKLTGIRANLKGLKRQYMLSMDMIPENEKTWKERGFKSERDYKEYLDDMYDDIRHGYIG